MKTNKKTETRSLQRQLLNTLGEMCLLEREPGDYTADDIIDALCILQQVAHTVAWNEQDKLNIPMEKREIIAEQFGKDLRGCITKFVGLDPVNIVDAWGKESVSVEFIEGL